MKKFIYTLLFVYAAASANVLAQGNEVVYIKSVRFVTPLLEKWIAEYAKVNPALHIKIAGKEVQPEEIAIHLHVSGAQAGDLSSYSRSFAIGRYAILPIAGKNNALLSDLKKKKLNTKRLKELFFEKNILDEDYATEKKDKYRATVYSVNNPASVSGAFAGYFDRTPSEFKGRKVNGDDIYLIHALQKDATGVSFNNLNYVYDTESRRLKDNIAILPLDLKKEESKVIEEANLDKLIDLLEKKEINTIPVEKVFFELQNPGNLEIQSFFQWILSEGQAFNHQFGLLKLDEKTAQKALTALAL
jgi:ABC-type phosphate transport system substrate-binding protein